jgi:hypothetical protein
MPVRAAQIRAGREATMIVTPFALGVEPLAQTAVLFLGDFDIGI